MSGQFRFTKLLFLSFLSLFLFALSGYSADLYWVNGSGAWDDPAHWSYQSGGEPANVIPTKDDNVIFDENSFSASGQYVKIKGKAECNDLIWETSPHQPTFESRSFIFKKLTGAQLNVYGSLIVEEEVKNEFYGGINFKSGQKENTIKASQQLKSDITFDGFGGSWKLDGDLTTKEDIHLKQGTLNTNDRKVEANEFIGSGTEESALYLGNSDIIVDKWDFEDSQKLDFDSHQSTIFFKEDNLQESFNPGGLLYNSLSSYQKSGSKSDLSLSLDTDSVSCYEGSDGVIYAFIDGGYAPYDYELRDSDNATVLETITTDSDSVAFEEGYEAGRYYVSVEDDDGQYKASNVDVHEPDPLVIDSVECVQ
ncbi:MAG: SprB repeat-containing protein, partial [Bacteroidales bacterium]